MASLIEHWAKEHAYARCYMWDKSKAQNVDGCIFYAKEKHEAHYIMLKGMKEKNVYWCGTAPRSRLLNWLAHKLFELAWGRNLFNGPYG